METFNGNSASVHVAYAFNDVACLFPITPSSPMGEIVDGWSAQGRKNLYGNVLEIAQMQSEGGAAGAVHGCLAAGSLATTFTASQGLLLMIPNMFRIAGMLYPTVWHIAARGIAQSSWTIHGDHMDVMACRPTGWAILSSHSVQECMDMSLVAHVATLKTRVPFMHFFDGFQLSHEFAKIHPISYDDMKKLVPWEAIQSHRENGLNPNHPKFVGPVQPPEVWMQNQELSNKFFWAAPDIVQGVMDDVKEITGRSYHLFDYYGDPNAEFVVVIMGAACEILEETVDYLREIKKQKVGIIKIRLYRPWSQKHFLDCIPKSCKRISVLDRTREAGALGDPIYLDVCASIMDSPLNIKVVGGRYGLGNKFFSPVHGKAVFDNLMAPEPRNHFTVGIIDDVGLTHLETPEWFSTIPDTTKQCLFFGLGADGTVGANIEAVKIIGQGTDLYCQAQFAFDSHKSGGTTKSMLRFGPDRIRSHYEIETADYVACHHHSYLWKFGGNLVKLLNQGGTFVYNTSEDPLKVKHSLPGSLKRMLAEKNAKFYVINAYSIADSVGLHRRVNMILQTVFFKLSGVLPIEKAIALLKDSIHRAYGKKGDAVVQQNLKAVDASLEALVTVEYDRDEWLAAPLEAPKELGDVPQWWKDVIEPVLMMQGNELPTSVFPPGGGNPTGTAQYEKQ